MIARIQKALVLSLLLGSLLSAAVAAWYDRPLLALALALAAPVLHALLLGLEFVLRARLARRQGEALGTASLLRAWWLESGASMRVFGWRQPFRSRRWPDRVEPSSKPRRGVLFVHGFFCNRGLWNPWLRRLTGLEVPFVAVNLEPIWGSIDDYVPIIEQAVSRLQAQTGLPPVVVAHSMGGLALRRWWAEDGNGGRVHRVITIGTPHHGTWLARLALPLNARQMRLGSAWLQALAQRERDGRYARMVCFHGNCDNIVFPTATATLAGADNRLLTCAPHVQMTDRDEPAAELMRLLAAPGA